MISPILLASSTASNGIAIFQPLYWFFGKCMQFLLSILNDNYFIALVIFTLVTRLVLLPINIHQQKTTAKTSRLQPKIQKIQKKYPDMRDRDKMNAEMQDLYAREGHNPMQMGCGPMMFQMVFLMGIIGIIYYPLTYVLGISGIKDQSSAILKFMQKSLGYKGSYYQLGLLSNFAEHKAEFVKAFPKIFTDANCDKIVDYASHMKLFGIDMTTFPTWKGAHFIIIVPLLCLVTSLGTSLISTMIQKKNNPAAAQQMQSMMLMMLMMPLFSFYISFKVPAAVGVYWIISNLIAMLQTIYINKVHPPRQAQAKLMLDNTIERRSREESIKKLTEKK